MYSKTELLKKAVQWRRDLHRQPEVRWQEHGTALYIREQLSAVGIQWQSVAETGTLVRLNSTAQGPHRALRGDIDALPIDEQTQVPWASKTAGVMHACGHDGHSAVLLATAYWLKQHEAQLTGPVTLIFQPAEEGGHGAKAVIEAGGLKGVDEIYGWHNWPSLPFGTLMCPNATVMCGNATFDVQFNGRGGHASSPEQCRDALLAAAAAVVNLQQIVSRRFAATDPVVVSVTRFIADADYTTLSESACIAGSVRFARPQQLDELEALIKSVCLHTAAAYGVEATCKMKPRYAPTVNHSDQASYVREQWLACGYPLLPDEQLSAPLMASEDFSYYLRHCPGAFAIVGGNPSLDPRPSCHSPHYDFNDDLIEPVLNWFSALVGLPQQQTLNNPHQEDA